MVGYTVLVLVLMAMLLLSTYAMRERFQGARSEKTYATNAMNHMSWAGGDIDSVPLNSLPAVYSHVATNNRFPDNIRDQGRWIASPMEYQLYIRNSRAARISSPVSSGYYVVMGLPAKMFAQECGFDWHGKRIGYIDWCDMYLIQSIMRGYRIPDDAVDVVPIPMTEWGRLPTYISMEDIDMIVACIVPDSPFHTLLKQQQLSILGWNKLDMDRVSVFYPFIEKVNIDVRKLLTQDGSSALSVMDREKFGPLLKIDFRMYRVKSSSARESFITRLDITPESIDPTYRCYGDLSIEQKALCDSPYDAHGEPKVRPTIWDRPCVKNDDCPFYKANKRYPNSRGGCLRGGICEMPVGVLRTAFRTYKTDGLFAPFCYGCADSRDPNCCAKQASPDYAFSKDYTARSRHNVATFVSAL